MKAPVFNGLRRTGTAPTSSVATGWQTVFPVLAARPAAAPARTSSTTTSRSSSPRRSSRSGPSETYRSGLHGIAGSPWLRDLLRRALRRRRPGSFQYGVDHDVYFPRPIERRRDTDRLLRARRHAAPRRRARRSSRWPSCGAAARTCGSCCSATASRRRRRSRTSTSASRRPSSWPGLYSEATVGLCLSMTNYSLIPQEMLACGLPCVDLDGRERELGVRRATGRSSSRPSTPTRSPTRSSGCSTTRTAGSGGRRPGATFVRAHTWDAAAEQVEAELRTRSGCGRRAKPMPRSKPSHGGRLPVLRTPAALAGLSRRAPARRYPAAGRSYPPAFARCEQRHGVIPILTRHLHSARARTRTRAAERRSRLTGRRRCRRARIARQTRTPASGPPAAARSARVHGAARRDLGAAHPAVPGSRRELPLRLPADPGREGAAAGRSGATALLHRRAARAKRLERGATRRRARRATGVEPRARAAVAARRATAWMRAGGRTEAAPIRRRRTRRCPT